MSTPSFAVHQHGTDSSGRKIWFTDYGWAAWQLVLNDPKVKPFAHKVVIVQGCFQKRNGGGAAASAGYHDQAGAWDIRIWNLNWFQQRQLIRALRRHGIAAWKRTKARNRGGMDPHIHCCLGSDQPLAPGLAWQWGQYLKNKSGLASGGRDYHSRPKPLVTKPNFTKGK